MTVKREFWWLPRPSKSKYPGSFPLHFEKRLLKLLEIDPQKAEILHPFGGCAEHGETVELPERKEYFEKNCDSRYYPTYFGDAHNLRLLEVTEVGNTVIELLDDSYDITICDPAYSDNENRLLYGIDPKRHPLRRKTWQAEAVRVTKSGGFVALYHQLLLPRPEGTNWEYLIAIATRTNHTGRFCGVFKKE